MENRYKLVTEINQHLDSSYFEAAPGAAVLVSVGGETIYENCRGVANVSTQEKITSNSNFRLASVSKQFTAMGIALLEQRGQLTYDTPLSHYLPEMGKLGKSITLRHLLTHTSGLVDYEAFVPETRSKQVTDPEVLQIISSQQRTFFTPGTAFRYSNTGFVLLGLVLEKVAGAPFADFLRENIFQPLGMLHSTVYGLETEIKHRAMGYALSPSGEVIFSDQGTCTATQGDGCLYSSLHDFALWHRALSTNPAFNKEALLKKISAPIQRGEGWRYGMGWFFSERKDGSLELYHTGNTSGFSHLILYLPKKDFFLVCLTNIADNPHLIPDLIQILSEAADFGLDSDLIWALPELTR